jgi:transposase
MEKWNWIRQRVLRDGVSIREIQRKTGLHFTTIKKVLENSSPLEFQCPERPKPKIGPFLERIAGILHADKSMHRKQRHTAIKIFEVIQSEGYEGGYTAVKDAVRELKKTSGEVFVPLIHHPGEAQMDFGQALVKMSGVLRKVMFFAMVLPYSDAMFIVAYARECTETFQDGHVRAFRFFDGVPTRISYDNAKTSVSQIIGKRGRKLTDGFLHLQSHYLFKEHFCQVRRPNEKGVVEGVVKGYTEIVRIFRKDTLIAEHERIWEKEDIAFDPIHYLKLLERKPGALDHAKPLHDWDLPECFTHLRKRLEDEARAEGTREFIRILQLLEKHPMDKVSTAIDKALRLQRCNRDVVANYLYPDESFSPPTFRLEGREHLQGVVVESPDLSVYQILVGGVK